MRQYDVPGRRGGGGGGGEAFARHRAPLILPLWMDFGPNSPPPTLPPYSRSPYRTSNGKKRSEFPVISGGDFPLLTPIPADKGGIGCVGGGERGHLGRGGGGLP
jgi:hypothetical protein